MEVWRHGDDLLDILLTYSGISCYFSRMSNCCFAIFANLTRSSAAGKRVPRMI